MEPTRRSLLRAGGIASVIGLAGCGERFGTGETAQSATTSDEVGDGGTEERQLDRGPLPPAALWVSPSREPPGFLPGRFFRQVSARAVSDNESRLHPAVVDEFSQELWDRPRRLFGVDRDSIAAKYQVTGQQVRILEGTFDSAVIGDYLGRAFEHVGQRRGLDLFARQTGRGERLVAVGEDYLVAGGREDAESALDARFGARNSLALVDEHFWEAAVSVADADLVSVTDRWGNVLRPPP